MPSVSSKRQSLRLKVRQQLSWHWVRQSPGRQHRQPSKEAAGLRALTAKATGPTSQVRWKRPCPGRDRPGARTEGWLQTVAHHRLEVAEGHRAGQQDKGVAEPAL